MSFLANQFENTVTSFQPTSIRKNAKHNSNQATYVAATHLIILQKFFPKNELKKQTKKDPWSIIKIAVLRELF